jgi:D-amino-acid oxidase
LAIATLTISQMTDFVTVLGAGYTGLTTAAELALRGHRVRVIAKDLGQMPPLTIAGTQSRRWPGTATSNGAFDSDDLLRRELQTIRRFMSLSSQPASGIEIVPALKVSREAGNWWNRRPITDTQLLAESTECQRNMRAAARPAAVSAEAIQSFKDVGYKSVDETQVVKIDTKVYFDFLIGIIKQHDGQLLMGNTLSPDDISKMNGAIVNCLGCAAQNIGGAEGDYYNSPGECVIVRDSPKDFGFYVMDDDASAGVMQCPDGALYMSTAAKPNEGQGYDESCSRQTVTDCDQICKALFGKTISSDLVSESWLTDRPMRSEGFNVSAATLKSGHCMVQNNGHGGAGVAASWGCASMVADALAGNQGKSKL